MYLYTNAWSRISPILTSLLSQRTQFSLNCKKIIALKIACKIVAFFTENYPSFNSKLQWCQKALLIWGIQFEIVIRSDRDKSIDGAPVSIAIKSDCKVRYQRTGTTVLFFIFSVLRFLMIGFWRSDPAPNIWLLVHFEAP